jgi:DNA end-binding protein Ku
VCGVRAAHVISFNDMPPHALGSGTISFGLVSIPIKLYTATAPGNISFNLLHAKCGSRIKQQTFCPVDNEVVERSGLVKGYEFAKDQYVRVTDEELKALEGEASKMIDILEFVPLAQVDPVYFEKAYYLGADKGGEKPYRLLADAMAQAEQVAVAKFVMRGKESLVLIRAAQEGLLLHTMFFADEVRSFADVDKGQSANIREGELQLALQLIRGLANEEFKPEQYKDDYRARVQEMLERKIEGREILPAPAPAERPRVIDLMDALKASLAKRGLPESAATAKKPPSKAATAAAAKVAAKAAPRRASGGRK